MGSRIVYSNHELRCQEWANLPYDCPVYGVDLNWVQPRVLHTFSSLTHSLTITLILLPSYSLTPTLFSRCTSLLLSYFLTLIFTKDGEGNAWTVQNEYELETVTWLQKPPGQRPVGPKGQQWDAPRCWQTALRAPRFITTKVM